MSDRLEPIPTPRAMLWRQVRLQYLPGIIFAIGLAAAATIWMRWVAPPTLVAEVEAVRTEVRAIAPGALANVGVDLLQQVTAGQVIAQLVPTQPKVLEASLATIRAEIEMMRATMDPVIGQQRMALDFERLQLDWLSERVKLSALRSQLNQAEMTFTRTSALHRNNLVAEEEFELAKNTRDALTTQVAAQAELVARIEPSLRALTAENATGVASPAAGLRAAIKHKEEEIRLTEAQLGPVPLIAPIDGVVTLIFRRAGENVAPGEPIFQISATDSQRIIGFVRQPLSIEPKPGMTVEVRTRTQPRRMGTATVAQVGQQMEPITPSLLAAMRLPVSAISTELGLRVHVTKPAGLVLRPGEQVDVVVKAD